MNYQNYSGASASGEANTPQENKQKDRTTRNVLLGLLGAVLLGSVAYLGYGWNKAADSNKVKDGLVSSQTARADSLTTERDQLRAQYDAISAKLDSLSGVNSSMALKISDRDGEVARLKSEIRRLMNKESDGSISLSENRRLRQAMAELQSRANGLEAEVARLRYENDSLISYSNRITYEKDSVSTENVKVTAEKNTLAEKVDVGSTLYASNFSMKGVDVKRSGRQKTTSVANKVDKLQVSFLVDQNRITEAGPKDIYVVIKDPAGNPITSNDLGSGQFSTRENETKTFTKKVTIDYVPNQSKQVDVAWEQDVNYKKGDYVFEVYQNGFKIGEGRKTLEKRKFLGIF
jgi:predicted nuclease with TOPRIM domain